MATAEGVNKRKLNANPFDLLPEDMVLEILKRISTKPLFKLMVYQRCKPLVSDLKFAQIYLKYSHPALQLKGLLYPFWYTKKKQIRQSLSSVSPLGFTTIAPLGLLRHPMFFHYGVKVHIRILGSGNGLVLSQMETTASSTIHLCITNPLTRQTIYLPKFDCSLRVWRRSCGFATRDQAFKAIFFAKRQRYASSNEDPHSVVVRTLCSGVGEWRVVKFSVEDSLVDALFGNSLMAQDLCHKGVLYWLDRGKRKLLSYDPFDSPDRFGLISLPQGSVEVEVVASMVVARLGREDESIECCEVERRFGASVLSLGVWRLVDYGKQEWSLQRRCEISPLCASNQLFLQNCKRVIGSDPRDPEESYCYVFARDRRITAIDLASGEEEDVGIPSVSPGMHQAFDTLPLLPFVPSPWSSLHCPPFNTH